MLSGGTRTLRRGETLEERVSDLSSRGMDYLRGYTDSRLECKRTSEDGNSLRRKLHLVTGDCEVLETLATSEVFESPVILSAARKLP